MAKNSSKGLDLLLQGAGLGVRPIPSEDVPSDLPDSTAPASSPVADPPSQSQEPVDLPFPDNLGGQEPLPHSGSSLPRQETAAPLPPKSSAPSGKKRGRKPKVTPEQGVPCAYVGVTVPGVLWNLSESLFTPAGRTRSGFMKDVLSVFLVSCGFSPSEIGSSSEEISLIKKRYSK